MVLQFYAGEWLMFSPYKEKIDEVYASLQEYFKIEDDGELNNYIGIEMERRLYGSIHLRQPYLTQIIINMFLVIYKSSTNPTPAVKPPLEKNEGDQATKNELNYRSIIRSLNFLKI